MSQLYLDRVVGSIIKENLPKRDEGRLREQILQNADELASESRICQALSFRQLSRSQRILFELILTVILDSPDFACTEEGVFKAVEEYERALIAKASDDAVISLSDSRAVEIYLVVLEVALADNEITPDEFNLVDRLREKLKLTRYEHRLLEARLGKFPKPNSELHVFAEVRDAIAQLQKLGVILYCNRSTTGLNVLIPEEFAPAVKACLGYEMSDKAQTSLLQSLNSKQLHTILSAFSLPVSGSKEERVARLLNCQCKPSEMLDTLSNDEIQEICRRLQGVKISGAKSEKIVRIIKYYDSLLPDVPEMNGDPRTIFYQFYEQFASRDNKNLYEKKIITRDRDMEGGFEEGTRYLFEEKFGWPLLAFNGSDHADGGIELENGQLLLWDNKGKESMYSFPKSHADQFKRYLRESVKPVSIFLIIVPDIDDKAELQAKRIKIETNTDVGIITAQDLKFMAESWPEVVRLARRPREKFPLQIFNSTGILKRSALKEALNIVMN